MEERKLAAIMFADIVGYSRMMGEDEQQTLKLLHDFEANVTPMIQRKKGAVLKKVGDNLFCEFSSAINAVECAVEIQEFLHEYNQKQPENFQCRVRIGIHVGDVVKRENDLFGDGVNLTARIQPLAPAGGICISQTVFSAIRSHARFRVVTLGKHKLKNIKQKQAIFQVLTAYDAPHEQITLGNLVRNTRGLVQKHKALTYGSIVLLLMLTAFTAKVAFFSSNEIMTNKILQPQPDSGAIAEAALNSEIMLLQTRLDSVKREMSGAMDVAIAFGAPNKSPKLFRRAQDKKNLANAHAVSTHPDSFRIAIKAYGDAEEGFKNAKIYITNTAQLAEKARLAQDAMRRVKDDVPGSITEKEADKNYQNAIAKERAAQKNFRAGDFVLALTVTLEAKDLFEKAQITISEALRGVADQHKQEMITAKKKVDPSKLALHDNLKQRYEQGVSAEKAGNSAYNKNTYSQAAAKYNRAVQDFQFVASELAVIEMTVHKAIEAVKNKFEQSISDEDIDALAALFKNFSIEEEKKWQNLFKFTSDLTAEVGISETVIENNTASVELLAKFFFKNNKKKASEDNFAYTWQLEKIDSKWLIAKFDQRLIAGK